jgi:hypothetical protein
MPSSAFTSAGTKISIAPMPAGTYNEALLVGITTAWDEVGEVTDLGEFGREYSLVTHNPLATRRTVKRKGSFNDGTVTMQMARAPADDGQDALLDALDDDASFAFKVELQDGTLLLFSAQIMSYTTNVGNSDQIVTASVSLEIDNDIFEVPPSP